MAFNPSSFVKDSDKSFTNRITDPIVNTSTYGLPASTSTIASATANLLLKIGFGNELLSHLVASRTDNAINGGADEYYAIAGKDPVRASRVDIQKLRKNKLNINDYLQNVNPQTKIAAFKEDNTVEIITVL